jgi:hypothetical protein
MPNGDAFDRQAIFHDVPVSNETATIASGFNSS